MMKSKMNKLINELSDAPFKYGQNDCFIFTNLLVEEWHGKGYAHLHKYKNKKEALKYVSDYGLEHLVTGTLGYSVLPTKCRDGDVVVAHVGPNNSAALGFVYDGHALFKCEKTVKKLPLKDCAEGWRIK